MVGNIAVKTLERQYCGDGALAEKSGCALHGAIRASCTNLPADSQSDVLNRIGAVSEVNIYLKDVLGAGTGMSKGDMELKRMPDKRYEN